MLLPWCSWQWIYFTSSSSVRSRWSHFIFMFRWLREQRLIICCMFIIWEILWRNPALSTYDSNIVEPTMFVMYFADLAEQSCANPGSPQFGSVSPNLSRYVVAQKVIFSCDDGYHLKGSETSTCGKSGKFSNRVPICESIFVDSKMY